ncbi:MAG: gliding motility-associated C-terminal domain-containing protein [Ferruginibacter sp.]
MKSAVTLLLLFFYCFPTGIQAQSCFNVAAGKDTVISCGQPCLDLIARVPDIRTTDDYSVVPIPYNPYPFTSPSGNELTLLYQDDKFSDSLDMPFTFCFYGKTYNKLSVGSNGVITFDVTTNATKDESYVINNSNTIPFAGGIPDNITVFYAPRASLFLSYYDMDPRAAWSPRERKIEWRLEGTAPCRKMIISYYHVDYYHEFAPATACANMLCTMQAVLYEGTGLIDVFYENKPSCLSYFEGLSIAGVQNWNQDKAVEIPGKNCTAWTATHEAYRYVPSGAGSLLNRVELYKNGALIATGTTTPLGNGELEVTFPNICQPENSADYVVKAFYQKCDNLLIETEGSDTMNVSRAAFISTSNITHASCKNQNGTITVTSPVGPTIEYSINGGANWQASNIFNRPAGTYTVLVRTTNQVCNTSFTATITEPALLTAGATRHDATCAGNDGNITVIASGGTPLYSYSIDGGITYQNNGTFPAAPGAYNNILVKDANNCIATSNAVVNFTDQMFLTLGNDTTVCEGASVTLQPITNTQTSNFLWSPASFLNSNTVKNPVATPLDTIRYTLTAKWGVCQRTDDIVISVLHKPVVNAGNDTIICYGDRAMLTGLISHTSGAVNYLWSPANKVLSAASLITKSNTASTQIITLQVTDNYGCHFSVSDDKLVTVRPPVMAFAGNDTIAVRGVPHQLSGLGSSGGTSYLWSPAIGLDNPFSQNPRATLYNDTYFTLVVQNDIGCSVTDDVFVKVYKGPTYYLPNAFSPNGDGLNDVFRAIPAGIVSTDYFAIYNRFGQLLFKNSNPLQGWDGTYKGKKADTGTYVWMISGTDRDGKKVEMKGTVLLLK